MQNLFGYVFEIGQGFIELTLFLRDRTLKELLTYKSTSSAFIVDLVLLHVLLLSFCKHVFERISIKNDISHSDFLDGNIYSHQPSLATQEYVAHEKR